MHSIRFALGLRALLWGLVILITSCGRGNAESQSASTRESSAASPDLQRYSARWNDAIDVAIGDAHAGPWRMNESEFHYVDDPSVAMREDGSVGVVWADNRLKDLFFQAYDAAGKPELATPTNVSRTPGMFSWLPRAVMTNDDQVFVLWQEIVFSGGSHGGDIFFSRSTDAGKSFSAPVNLSNTSAGDGKGRLTESQWDNGSLDLVRAPGGQLGAAWTDYEGSLWFARSSDEGRSFSPPLQIAGTTPQPARGPSLAAGAEGALYVVWTVGEQPAADIHLAVSRDGGQTFGPPRIVRRSRAHSDAPKIGVDRRGFIHIVYDESSAGPFGTSHVWYARSLDGGRTFGEAHKISDSRENAAASFPALALDARGNAYVAWEHHPGAREHAHGLAFTVSWDSGKTFSPPSVVPGTVERALGINGSRQGKLMRKLAVNEAGAIAIVNSYFQEGERSRVRLILGRTSY